MARPLSPFSIQAPGFYGLNTAESPVDLSPNFALEANNCVIDKFGRVAGRKGWVKANTASTELSTAQVCAIGEVIENDGTGTVLCAGNNKLFKLSSGSLVELTYGGGGVAPTILDNNWKFCQLNGVGIFWQRNYDALIYDPAVSTTTYRRLSEKTGSVGTVPDANEAISAFGRIWAADTVTERQIVYFSDLQAPHIWTGGTSGTLDIGELWPLGGDQIVALAAHNNRLFIMGKKQILVFTNATNPASISLEDSIVGIGCISRDSVQNIGTDVLFLSDTGVRSMLRTIQEKSAPIRDLSKNIRDDLMEYLSLEDAEDIKSGYSQVNQFYLLRLPIGDITYCFDTRGTLPDGSARVTAWPNFFARAFFETSNRKFYIGKSGYIGEYSGFLDDTETYRMTYFTTWIDFGNPVQTSILKKIRYTMIGGAAQTLIFKWAKDYENFYRSETTDIDGSPNAAEYNIAEYNTTWEYTTGIFVEEVSVNGGGSGRVWQFGLEATINNQNVSIQKLEVTTKDGRI